MSDLSSLALESTAQPQLPIHWYFDPKIYELEKRILFDAGPAYMGHDLMVPNQGDFHSLAWLGDSRALVRGETDDFSGCQFHHVDIDEYDCNWKTFIEVYLEDYHVEPFHPGLGNFVDVNNLRWQFGHWYSVQTCGVSRSLAKPGSAVYRRWHDQVLRYNEGKEPAHGAIWLTYFPNIMVEWYPHSLVISTIVPRGPEACTNVVEFYYPEDIALFEPEFVEAEQAAYRETAVEDMEICARMTEGRRALMHQGISETGPYQSPMEDGMRHFHEFLRREIGAHL